MSNDVQPRADGWTFSDHQRSELARRAISVERAVAAGVRPVHSDGDLPTAGPEYWRTYLPGMCYPWRDLDGGEQWQFKPDTPAVGQDGKPRKYLFAPGWSPRLNVIRRAPGDRVLIVEGTHQAIAAGVYAPDHWSVLGIAGCRGWSSEGLPTPDFTQLYGATVVVVLDADIDTNPDVWAAGQALARELQLSGVASVRFAQVSGGRNSGLDDVLGARPEDARADYVARLISPEHTREPNKIRKPAKRDRDREEAAARREERAAEPGRQYFDPTSGQLLAKSLAEAVRASRPAALTAENKIAIYQNGVYGIDGGAFTSAVTELLGESFSKGALSTCEAFLYGQLYGERAVLPDRMKSPRLNVLNGMLDLRTGELRPHDPRYFSTVQFPVVWDPETTSPTYDAWLEEAVGTEQAAVLEEAVSAVLDPSTTPHKALMLFGPSKSGKSTFLRLLKAMVGDRNSSGVSLHQLSDDSFAAANVYGKALNVSADLSSRHVEDLSAFKLLTGEDLIHANRKYGQQFEFTNRALFAFSANRLPTVGEDSRAYTNRMVPINFPHSFEGHEDPAIELAMLDELPGILRRWVAAWQARRARGESLRPVPAVLAKFEQSSDRVAEFLANRYILGRGFSTTSEIHTQFKRWAEEEGRTTMGRSTLAERLRAATGVAELVHPQTKTRGWALELKAQSDWGHTESSEVAELGRSGVSLSPRSEGVVAELRSVSKKGRGGDSKNENARNDPSYSDPQLCNSATDTLVSQNQIKSDSYVEPASYLVPWSLTNYVSRCQTCGADEVLVDRLWFACPTCHPETIRPWPAEES